MSLVGHPILSCHVFATQPYRLCFLLTHVAAFSLFNCRKLLHLSAEHSNPRRASRSRLQLLKAILLLTTPAWNPGSESQCLNVLLALSEPTSPTLGFAIYAPKGETECRAQKHGNTPPSPL